MQRVILIFLVGVVVITLSADDTELFKVSVPPRILIDLDYSRSMWLNPPADSAWGPAKPGYYNPPWGWCPYQRWYPWLPYCAEAQSRYGILKQALFTVLDADSNGVIDGNDEKKLGIDIGLLRFGGLPYQQNQYGGQLGWCYVGEPTTRWKVVRPIGSSYSSIWDYVRKVIPLGGTQIVNSLGFGTDTVGHKACGKYLIEDVFPTDPARHCRRYCILLMTDGEETHACGGDGSSTDTTRRRASVHESWLLHRLCPDSLQKDSVLVFVVGFGKMSQSYKNVLNWMAYYGGTDDPNTPNNIVSWYDRPQDSCTGTKDPQNYGCSGYAFICENAGDLQEAFKVIFEQVSKMKYSFSSVAAPTVITERFGADSTAFVGSFIPDVKAFWEGHLYKVKLDTALEITDTLWDAGKILKLQNPDVRHIYTLKNGSWCPFDSANIAPADLDVANETEKMKIINRVRGMPGQWKLGDIFHSSPLVVGPPVPFFYDTGYREYLKLWENRDPLVYVGANDGTFHVFEAGKTPLAGGDEVLAFIPPEQLTRLKTMALQDSHTYYVDGPPIAYEIWDDKNGDGKKDSTEWKTLLVCGMRRGGRSYFTMEITDPSKLYHDPPLIPPPTIIADPLLGQTWSTPVIDRIRHWSSGHYAERWFVCFGGGYDTTSSDTGRSFYIVDIGGDNNGANSIGTIRFDPSNTPGLTHCFPSSPAVADIVDTTRPGGIFPDGYADAIFIGDHGGNMWLVDIASSDVSKWRMAKVFQNFNPELHCFFAPSLALQGVEQNVGDTVIVLKKIPWLFWGTGDRANPADTLTVNRFYALRYPDTLNVADETMLDDITGGGLPDTTKHGWFIRLEPGEKVVSTPIVVENMLYFTTFKPEEAATADPCQPSVGTSYLYGMDAWTGVGLFSGARRRAIAVPGIPPQPKVILGATEAKILLPGEAVVVPLEKLPRVRYESWESTK